MKKLSTLFSLLASAVIVTAYAGEAKAVNLLVNGELDLPANGPVITGWTKEEFKSGSGPSSDLITLEDFIEMGPVTNGGLANDRGGFVKAFQGNATTGDLATMHLSQAVAGVSGLQYLLTGWLGAGANYSGLLANNITKTQMAIEFDTDNNRTNGILSASVLDVKAAGLAAGGCCAFGGQQFSVSGTAPLGTLFVHARFSMVDGFGTSGGDQAVFIDDFSLDIVPEPATLGLGLIGILGFLGLARRR